jgi:hypothetical protein
MNSDLLKRIYSATCTAFHSLPAEILTEIEAELAKPEAEPIAWIDSHGLNKLRCTEFTAAMVQNKYSKGMSPLYAPPRDSWIGSPMFKPMLYAGMQHFPKIEHATEVANQLTKDWKEFVTIERVPGTTLWRVTNRHDPRIIKLVKGLV